MKIRVRIIELNRARCEHLSKILPDVTVINGDGTKTSAPLMQEGLPMRKSFVSLTNMDEDEYFPLTFCRAADRRAEDRHQSKSCGVYGDHRTRPTSAV
ncbi:MAG: hypothetical protein ACLR2E_03185 [Lachnospiraceae bacterium]